MGGSCFKGEKMIHFLDIFRDDICTKCLSERYCCGTGGLEKGQGPKQSSDHWLGKTAIKNITGIRDYI